MGRLTSGQRKGVRSRSNASICIVVCWKAVRVRRFWKFFIKKLEFVWLRTFPPLLQFSKRYSLYVVFQNTSEAYQTSNHFPCWWISGHRGLEYIPYIHFFSEGPWYLYKSEAYIKPYTSQVPTIISDFSHLKMLGHVYVVEDAKDLAQIVRDVTRYGGAYRPEVSRYFRAGISHCLIFVTVGYIWIHSAAVGLEENRENGR